MYIYAVDGYVSDLSQPMINVILLEALRPVLYTSIFCVALSAFLLVVVSDYGLIVFVNIHVLGCLPM